MWDFEIGRTLGIVARTWPFVLFRMVVYFGITVAYIAATGMGAGVGYGTGHILGEGGGPVTFALWGGIIGAFDAATVIFRSSAIPTLRGTTSTVVAGIWMLGVLIVLAIVVAWKRKNVVRDELVMV